jgi:FAD/FMN-containing dehydrogenase
MTERWQPALPTAAAHRPWPRSLGGAPIVKPASLDALATDLRNAPDGSLRPLGSGTDGLASSKPDALYQLYHLLGPAAVDEASATLDLPASMTWSEAQAVAAAYSLTLTDIPDAFGDATIGGTLARAPWQPTLHHSATARARCIGLSAMMLTGERYSYKTASRTASGPDLRTHFLGRAGATGPILRATIEASREAHLPHDLSLPLTADSLQAVIGLQRRFGRALRLLPTPAAATLRLRLRSDRPETPLLLDALEGLGAHPTAPLTTERPAADRWLTLPFAEASALIEANADLFCLALGPTHLTVALRRSHPPIAFANHELIREGLLGAGFTRHSEVSQ